MVPFIIMGNVVQTFESLWMKSLTVFNSNERQFVSLSCGVVSLSMRFCKAELQFDYFRFEMCENPSLRKGKTLEFCSPFLQTKLSHCPRDPRLSSRPSTYTASF